ncbi:MAG: hypothetical protein U0Y68_25450 [Blastocatellia bacterium]
MVKRFPLLFLFVWLFGTASLAAPLAGNDLWLKINTKHFTLVGSAGEREMRAVGDKLEQFRANLCADLSNIHAASAVPITIIVFKNRSAYQPFPPLYNGTVNELAGIFSRAKMHITMAAEFGATNLYHVIIHEYVHALSHNAAKNLPARLHEGLSAAEFYSRSF